MKSFIWFVLRFAGKIIFLICASKFLAPELFVKLQSFTVAGETIVLASSSATAIFMSQRSAEGKKESFYWTINIIEILMALSFIIVLLCLRPLLSFMDDLSLLIIPFVIIALFVNLHYKHIIITKSNLIESQKFLIQYEVIPYILSAAVMAWTNSFENGILTLVISTGCSIFFWRHPNYAVSKSSIVHFLSFLQKMYIYTLVTFGLKTFERLVVIEKFYFD